MFNFKILTAGATSLALLASAAMSETVIRIQSVLGNSTDEVRMVEAFAKDVLELTGGSVKIEILPAGAVVGPRDIMDAVDAYPTHRVDTHFYLSTDCTLVTKPSLWAINLCLKIDQ